MPSHTPYKIAFVSLGCPKNLVDSQQILSHLKQAGLGFALDYKDANMVIINTCAFIDEAIKESIDTIEDAIKENSKVIITGCLGKQEQMLKQRFPKLLSVSAAGDINSVLRAVSYAFPDIDFNNNDDDNKQTDLLLTPPHYAYLKISEGCNHKCSFCIIPDLRGPLKSRTIDDILIQAYNLKNNGVKELLIIAQDTAAFGSDNKYKSSFFAGRVLKNNIKILCNELAKLGLWIRLHYVYPYEIVDDLVVMMAEGKILPYLDMPLQHANMAILKNMRRPAKAQNMIEKIKKWRQICPDLTIRSTFITGFPTETEQQFNELLDFLKIVKLDRVGCFTYSPVKGAKSNTLQPHITPAIQEHRKKTLMQLQADISYDLLQNKIGRTMEVIIDKINNKQIIARTRGDAPDIDGKVYIQKTKQQNKIFTGDLVKVKITKADSYDLFAVLE
ncbi:MAG: 30S ribosomal protein S12 methylthiotransferase RimO [Gammaproteobacteria bacterium]|nr:MAG: 30S ribosomal protein S12 methylthiotransferase RimO [Gammaproteobacteria bacterium]